MISSNLYTIKSLKSFGAWLFVLLPILNQYKIFPLQVMDVFACIGVLVFFILYKQIRIKTDKLILLIAILLYISVNTLIMGICIYQDKFATIFLKILRIWILYMFYYMFIFRMIDYDTFYKKYTFFVYIVSLSVIIQFFFFITMRQSIGLLIPNVEMMATGSTSSILMNTWKENATIGWYRPCSFFTEPAHLAQFILPWIAIQLQEIRDKSLPNYKDIHSVLLVSIACCISTSSIAISCIAVLWSFFLFHYMSDNKGRLKQTFLIILCLLITCTIVILKIPQIQKQIIIRLAESGTSEASSTSFRLFRGFNIFSQLQFDACSFGVGYGYIGEYLTTYNIKSVYDSLFMSSAQLEYMNGISMILCNLGIVGTLLFIFFIVDRIAYKKEKYLVLLLLLLLITSAYWDKCNYFLLCYLTFSKNIIVMREKDQI